MDERVCCAALRCVAHLRRADALREERLGDLLGLLVRGSATILPLISPCLPAVLHRFRRTRGCSLSAAREHGVCEAGAVQSSLRLTALCVSKALCPKRPLYPLREERDSHRLTDAQHPLAFRPLPFFRRSLPPRPSAPRWRRWCPRCSPAPTTTATVRAVASKFRTRTCLVFPVAPCASLRAALLLLLFFSTCP